MPVKFWRRVLIIVVVTGLLMPQVQRALAQSQPSPRTKLLVAAAASLQPALQAMTPLYQRLYPDQTVNYTFAASGPLQRQIEQGAPVDIFISAATKPMDALQTQGLLVPGTRKNLLTNQLVLITPKQSSGSLTDFQHLVQPEVERIAIGEPRSVPAGQYATEVFQSLGIFEQVKPKLVLGNSVRSVLATVETGDVDAGVVYITDAKSSNKVRIVAKAPPKLHAPIVYPIAIVRASPSLAAARTYVAFLQSPPAQTLFRKYGFGLAKF